MQHSKWRMVRSFPTDRALMRYGMLLKVMDAAEIVLERFQSCIRYHRQVWSLPWLSSVLLHSVIAVSHQYEGELSVSFDVCVGVSLCYRSVTDTANSSAPPLSIHQDHPAILTSSIRHLARDPLPNRPGPSAGIDQQQPIRWKHIPGHLLKLLPDEIRNLLVHGAVLIRCTRVSETVASFARDLLLHGVESYRWRSD